MQTRWPFLSNHYKSAGFEHKLIFIKTAIIMITMLIVILGHSCFNSTKDEEIKLSATILHSGRGFIVTNNNDYSWFNTKYYLNYQNDDLFSGYKYCEERDEISSNDTTFISEWEFTDREGDQFNINDPQKPVRLLIQAETKDGRKGSYLKVWSEITTSP
jgi:hypothetical protein